MLEDRSSRAEKWKVGVAYSLVAGKDRGCTRNQTQHWMIEHWEPLHHPISPPRLLDFLWHVDKDLFQSLADLPHLPTPLILISTSARNHEHLPTPRSPDRLRAPPKRPLQRHPLPDHPSEPYHPPATPEPPLRTQERDLTCSGEPLNATPEPSPCLLRSSLR